MQGVSVVEPRERIDESLLSEILSQFVDHGDIGPTHEHNKS